MRVVDSDFTCDAISTKIYTLPLGSTAQRFCLWRAQERAGGYVGGDLAVLGVAALIAATSSLDFCMAVGDRFSC